MQTNWFKVGICTSRHTPFVPAAFILTPSAHASPRFPSVQTEVWLLDSELPTLNSRRDHHLLFYYVTSQSAQILFLIRHPLLSSMWYLLPAATQQEPLLACWKNVQFLELNFDSVLHQDANTTSTSPARRLDRAAMKQQLS